MIVPVADVTCRDGGRTADRLIVIIGAIYRYAPPRSRRDPEIIYNNHYQSALTAQLSVYSTSRTDSMGSSPQTGQSGFRRTVTSSKVISAAS